MSTDLAEGATISVTSGRLKGSGGKVSHVIHEEGRVVVVAFWDDKTERLRFVQADRVRLAEEEAS